MSLFRSGQFTLSSGQLTTWKIDCDCFCDEDWKTIASLIAARTQFDEVFGIPSGGTPLAEALKVYSQKGFPRLLVDDVYTTGGSIVKWRKPGDLIWVVFARGRVPEKSGIKALWTLST
jgi:orotate phosphoribosyltransferase